MTDETKQSEGKEIREGKIFAILSYLGILCLVPLILKRDNEFALFHGKQGLVLFIGEVAASILSIIPVLGQLIFVLSVLLFGVLSLAGIMQALTGKYWKMPVVSDIAAKFTI